MKTKKIKIKLTIVDAKEVFEFIKVHLTVVNDTPAVEDLMIELEDQIYGDELEE